MRTRKIRTKVPELGETVTGTGVVWSYTNSHSTSMRERGTWKCHETPPNLFYCLPCFRTALQSRCNKVGGRSRDRRGG